MMKNTNHQPVYDILVLEGRELSVSELATVCRVELKKRGFDLRTVAASVKDMALVPMVGRGNISMGIK